MKMIIILLLAMTCIGCVSESENKIIADKYIEGFIRLKYSMSNNTLVKRDKELFALIDEIILQTNELSISQSLKERIVKEIAKVPKPRSSDEHERYNLLINLIPDFQQSKGQLITDLDFIDSFLEEKYWQHWQCNSAYHETEVFLRLDTILLQSNKVYELPIRVEYNGLPDLVSVLSNTLQGSRPNLIKFRTKDLSAQYQRVEYKSEVINIPTGAVMHIANDFVVRLVGD